MPTKKDRKRKSKTARRASTSTCPITLTVPLELRAQLDDVAQQFGITRSALAAQLLADVLGPISEFFEDVPRSPTVSDVKRMRGKSVDHIAGLIADMNVALSEVKKVGESDV